MSRLDSFIRRLLAQRACLEEAARRIEGLPGPVFELGLGAGRTYDHLREILPEREIFVFDREIVVHPRNAPDPDHTLLGDFCGALHRAAERVPAPAALAHADIGTWDEAASRALAAELGPALDPLMQVGGVVASDQPMAVGRWEPLALPRGVPPGRYFMYRVTRP